MEPSFNPWLSIWTKPRATIRRIVEENPNRSLWLLAFIYGLDSLISNAHALTLGQIIPPFILFPIIVILSPIWGYAFFSILSAAVLFIGKLFGGIATFRAVRAAFAWSCVPFAVSLVLLFATVFIFGQKLFMPNPVNQALSDKLTFLMFFILIAQVVLPIWSLIIYLKGLAEVQGYSVLKAIFNVILASIVMLFVGWIVWQIGMSLEPLITSLFGLNKQTLKVGFLLISGG